MIAIPPDQFTILLNSATGLTPEQRAAFEEVRKLAQTPVKTPASEALLLTQGEVAGVLGIHRTAVWRLTKKAILCPVEVMPDTYRYRRDEVETLAKHGYLHLLRQRRKAA